MPEWTSAQQRAIDARDTSLLVSAGAGSGKTAVLTARVTALLREGASIDDMLIVTFSRAAAAEMRARIASALEELEGDERLKRESMLVESAAIQTLHSFCSALLREHAGLLGLPPAFRVGEGARMARLKDEVLEEVMDALYESEPDEMFYASQVLGGVNAFNDALITLNTFLESIPDPDAWLNRAVSMYEGGGALWREALENHMGTLLDTAQSRTEEAMAVCRQPGGPAVYMSALEDDLEVIGEARAGEYGRPFAKLKAYKGERLDLKARATALREEVKGLIKACGGFSDEMEADGDALRIAAPAVSTLARAWRAFDAAFTKQKLRHGAMGFADLERMAYNALAMPPVAEAVRARYRCVFVDEYQDTSPLQEAIVSRAAHPDGLFTVGDVKQSIYSFRHAEPRIFIDRYDAYARGEGGEKVDLNQNFRSLAAVLDAVNYVFSRCMSRERGGVDYGVNHALVAGREGEGAPVEVALIDLVKSEGEDAASDELQSAQAEAAWAADWIARRLEREPSVTYGDIVILMRSTSGRAPVFERALAARGIPVLMDVAERADPSADLRAAASLLRLIGNTRDDEAFVGALLGLGFSYEDMAHIRMYERSAPLFVCAQGLAGKLSCVTDADAEDAGVGADAESAALPDANSAAFPSGVPDESAKPDDSDSTLTARLSAFLRDYDALRILAARERLTALADAVIDLRVRHAATYALPDGERRMASLGLLRARAAALDAESDARLPELLEAIEDGLRGGSDFVPLAPSGENAVRIMSVHKSKGLEFPIVLLTGLGVRFNFMDANRSLVLDRDMGIGIRGVEPDSGAAFNTLARSVMALRSKATTRGEEMRILYVAMTRAKDELVLLGGAQNARGSAMRWLNGLNEHALEEASAPWDYVMPALMRHPDGLPLRLLLDEEVPEEGGDPSRFYVSVLGRDDLPLPEGAPPSEITPELLRAAVEDAQALPAVYRALSFTYDPPADSALPLKIGVTAMTGRDAVDERPRPAFALPLGDGARRGNAAHAFLRALDFSLLRGAVDLRAALHAQLEDMAARRIIAPDDARLVSIDSVLSFFNTGLGRGALSSRRVLREQPFNIMMGGGTPFLAQGVIDLCYEEDGAWVLVDYKTDRVDGGVERVLARHRDQVLVYKRALQESTGMPVKACWLMLLAAGEAYPIEGDYEERGA